ncbi:hypothetical protein NB693_21270 [Pantoea ananatis]|uniref:hypothetical protein n=1 Tax=Pantoea ananas TaxID=553 RepID=UPI00222098E2|nr:hypothetical protein [Pantoea ananatis]
MKNLPKAALSTVLYIVVLLLLYYVHMRYFKVNVVFYASILDGVIAVVLVGGGLWLAKVFKSFTTLEVLQLLAIWLLGSRYP